MVRGLVRQLDHLGRIVIPKEMRDLLNMKTGDLIEIYTQNGRICIEKCKLQCTICGFTNEDKLVELDGVHICKDCAVKIARLSKGGEGNGRSIESRT